MAGQPCWIGGRLVTDTPLTDETLPRPRCCAAVFMSVFFFFFSWNERASGREAGNYVEEVAVRRSNNPFLMCIQEASFVFCQFNSIQFTSSPQPASKPKRVRTRSGYSVAPPRIVPLLRGEKKQNLKQIPDQFSKHNPHRVGRHLGCFLRRQQVSGGASAD